MKTFTIKSILIIISMIITTAGLAKNQDKKNELRWNEKTVQNYINVLKPPNKYKINNDEVIINIITNTAIANNIEVPTNIFGFTQFLLEFPSTNYEDSCRVLDIFYDITNEVLGDLLFFNYTNYYIETQVLIEKITRENTKIITDKFGDICYIESDLQNKIENNNELNLLKSKSQQSLWAIGNIGTPELIDKLNKVWIVIRKRDPFNFDVYPSYTINPDRFPKESEDWLFNSPYVKVRKHMVNNWLQSKRPEKIEILRRYIKKLEKTPKLNPVFTLGLRSYDDHNMMKRLIINKLKERVDETERQYKRWLEDGKRMPLDFGVYNDEYWGKYKKMTEEERKSLYLDKYKAKIPIPQKKLRRLKNQRLNQRYIPPKRIND